MNQAQDLQAVRTEYRKRCQRARTFGICVWGIVILTVVAISLAERNRPAAWFTWGVILLIGGAVSLWNDRCPVCRRWLPRGINQVQQCPRCQTHFSE